MASIHAFLVITLRASQIVSGLALTIFAGAAGLSSYLGNDLNLADEPAEPPVQPGLPHLDAALADRRADRLRSERARLRLLAAGRGAHLLPQPHAARPQRPRGRRVARPRPTRWASTSTRYRYAHTIAGGALAGVGGATYTLAITPQWVDGITGGAGWIAIALVIFAFWRPELCLVGAYFFGALQALAPELQARQITLGPTVLWTNALPYVATIVVLVDRLDEQRPAPTGSTGGARRRLRTRRALSLPPTASRRRVSRAALRQSPDAADPRGAQAHR